MFLRKWAERILRRSAPKPTEPTKSRFGAESSHQRYLDQAKKEMTFEIEKEKGRRRSW